MVSIKNKNTVFSIKAIYEVPLAVASFISYKLVRMLLTVIIRIFMLFRGNETTIWKVLSEKVVNNPLLLAVYMTRAPRWNTHAVVATLGPFDVKEKLSIRIADAKKSADSWSIVAYEVPRKTVSRITSTDSACDTDLHEMSLKSGEYMIGLRYYNVRENACLPAVLIDGEINVEPAAIRINENEFYETLKTKSNFIFTLIHYYMFVFLKYRRCLPKALVEKEYLPVGDPFNGFVYGHIEKGQSIKLTLSKRLLDRYDVYYTLYSTASLPREWLVIESEKNQLGAVKHDGSYLVRCRPKSKIDTVFDHSEIEVLTLS